MAGDIEVDVKSAMSALGAIEKKIEENILDALDGGAAAVQASAREGHPKVADKIQGAAARSLRERTKSGSGGFTGGYRFLTRTGNLRLSVKIERAKRVSGGFEASVFSAEKYADKVEYGGFPFIRPALELNRKNIQERVAAAVRMGIGK